MDDLRLIAESKAPHPDVVSPSCRQMWIDGFLAGLKHLREGGSGQRNLDRGNTNDGVYDWKP